MNKKEKLELIKRNTEEIINEKEISGLINKDCSVYCGYEPSGEIHLGHLVTMIKLLDLEKAGIKVKVLLANWHAWLNKKGSWGFLETQMKNWKKGFKAVGFKRAEFIKGTEIQRNLSYIDDVLLLALNTTLNRGVRSMQQVARDIEHAKISQVIYPLMQIEDIKALDVDFVVAGMDQRKIHMLGLEKFKNINLKKKIVFLHTPLISSLKGPGSKMSSSEKESFISIRDSKEQIKKKVSKAYCPKGIVKDNPILQIAKFILFPMFGSLDVKRDEKFGGEVSYNQYEDLEKEFISNKLHPADLKNCVAIYLEKLIEPIKKAWK